MTGGCGRGGGALGSALRPARRRCRRAEVERQVEHVGNRLAPGAEVPPRGRMTVRLSPEGSFHDSTAPGGAAASGAPPRRSPRCIGAPSEPGCAGEARGVGLGRRDRRGRRRARAGGGTARGGAGRRRTLRRRRNHRRHHERRRQLRRRVAGSRRAAARHAVERLHRIGVRRHVRLRRSLVERRARQRVDVAAAGACAPRPNSASSDSPPPPPAAAAAQAELRDQGLGATADIEAEIAAASAGRRLTERAGEVLALRRDRLRIGRERIPVLGNAARGGRRGEGAGA